MSKLSEKDLLLVLMHKGAQFGSQCSAMGHVTELIARSLNS